MDGMDGMDGRDDCRLAIGACRAHGIAAIFGCPLGGNHPRRGHGHRDDSSLPRGRGAAFPQPRLRRT